MVDSTEGGECRGAMPLLPGDVQWFPADIRRMLVAIKKEDVLWHPKHEGFGMRDQQARGWRAVAEEVGGGKTDMQCRDKWNCLRGTYRRHVRTESSNTVRRRSGWPWTENMSFLKPYVMEKDETAEKRTYRDEKWKCYVDNSTSTPPPQSNVFKPICPQLNTVTIPTGGVPTTKGAIITNQLNGILNGGIILAQSNGNMVKLVPTSQGNMVPMTSQANLVKVLQTSQGNMVPSMVKVMQASQCNTVQSNIVKVIPNSGLMQQQGLRLVPTTIGVVQPSTAQTPLKNNPSGKRTADVDPIEVDLKKVKPDPDGPNSLHQTEFVDMNRMMKKEPVDEEEEEEVEVEEMQFPEVEFLPEDSASQTSVASDVESFSVQEAAEKTKEPASTPKAPKADVESEDASDSNHMFMKSTVAHMRKMTAYQQSMFKLKVQQLLHEVMFPAAEK